MACSLALAVSLAGCADANGLHNQIASNVTFVFTNFSAAEDGSYAVPGNYNSWNNASTMLTLKSGEGSTASQTVTNSYVQFTLVKTNSWTRAWYPTVKGNSVDSSSGSYSNIYADITLGTDVTITVDGSTSPVTVTVK